MISDFCLRYSLDVDSNCYRWCRHRVGVMRILLSLWKEIPHPRRHSPTFGELLQARWVQACRNQPGGVELVDNVFRCALWLCSEVNHCAESAVKTVFATCSGLVDRNLGFRTQNPGDGQNLGFRCPCQGENVGVLTFECGEFVFGYRLAARKQATSQKAHVNNQ